MNTASKYTIDIYGDGAHARDLHERGIFEGFDITIIDKDDSIPKRKPDTSIIIVPISNASDLVDSIIKLRGKDHQMIDFSGLTRCTNVDIPMPFGQVSHAHFLSGPDTQENLRLAIIRGKVRNAVFEKIVVRFESKDVRIIDTSIEEHDVIMGFVQSLTHATALVLREMDSLPENITQRQDKTPIGTKVDMITLNRHTHPFIRKFVTHDGLKEALQVTIARIEEYLDLHDHILDDFSTPFFRLILEHIRNHSFEDFDWGEFSEKLMSIVTCSPEDLHKRYAAF